MCIGVMIGERGATSQPRGAAGSVQQGALQGSLSPQEKGLVEKGRKGSRRLGKRKPSPSSDRRRHPPRT